MSKSAILEVGEISLIKDAYLSELLQQSESQKAVIGEEWLQELRQKAASLVTQSNLPTKRDESWRFTDLSALLQVNFQIAETLNLKPETLTPFIVSEAQHSRLTFVNGVYSPELSSVSALPEGVYVGNLSNLPAAYHSKIAKYLGKQTGELEVFTALNTSGITDIAIIWANPNIIVETPIHLLFLATASDSPTFSQPRVLVIAEKGSSLQLVEYYGAIAEHCSDIPQNHPYFTNTVSEIWLEENAKINHSRIQRESGDSFHIAHSAIAQARDSSYTGNEISLGGKLYRHNLDIFQQGEQTYTQLNGLTMIGGKQFADTHSAIYLTKPGGTTDQLHKCIIDDSAHAVFNGRVIVPKAAQLTNASQLNRNLLLSPKARINTKPELQITADNVKCSHGATVSQLEADEVFYLQSRGLTEWDARHLLLDAFATEILNRLPIESLRHRLTQCVTCRTIDN